MTDDALGAQIMELTKQLKALVAEVRKLNELIGEDDTQQKPS
ncbi:MAG TPA: hypothetical protein VJK02_16850 [Anaerolineales bacterium]|nr:hypothetical protein [Anaerolineales bacterium]